MNSMPAKTALFMSPCPKTPKAPMKTPGQLENYQTLMADISNGKYSHSGSSSYSHQKTVS